MRKLALALITTSLTTGCLFTETGNNPQNTQDDSIVEQDMPTEPGPADMDDMGVVEGDMSPPAPDMRVEPSDLGSPDMDPPPSDMGCQPRRLELQLNCLADPRRPRRPKLRRRHRAPFTVYSPATLRAAEKSDINYRQIHRKTIQRSIQFNFNSIQYFG